MHTIRALRLILIVLALHLIGMAGAAGSIALGPVQTEIEALSGSTITLGVRIDNAGDSAITLNLQAELPAGWSVLIPPGELSVAAGETRVALVTVTVPADAPAGSYPLAVRVFERGSEAMGHAEFSVVIPLIERVSLTLAEGPEYVLGTSFSSAFLLRNEGNGPATWTLAARSSAGLELEVEPPEVSLEPNETARVEVVAIVPADLPASTRHTMTISARRAASTETLAEARANTMLIPSNVADAPAMHMYPLTASFGFGVRVADGISVSLPHVAVSGAGKLPGREAYVAIDVSGRPTDPVGSADLKVSYRASWGGVVLGHQSFAGPGFVGTERGFGVAFDTSWEASTLTFAADAHVYLASDDGGATGSAGLEASTPGGFFVGAHGQVAGSGPIGTISAGYRASSGTPSGMSLTHFGVTYGVRPASSDWRAGHALEVRGSAQAGPVSLGAVYRFGTASFSRTRLHGSELDLRAALRLPEGFAFSGMPAIGLQAQLTERRAWGDGDPSLNPPSAPAVGGKPDATESLERKFGVTFTTNIGGVAVVLGHRETFEQGGVTNRHASVTHVQVKAPLSEHLVLDQEVAWNRASDAVEQTVRNEASLEWSDTGAGDFAVGYVVDLGLTTLTPYEATLSAGWSDDIDSVLSLGADLSVDLLGHGHWAKLDLDVTTLLPNGHTLLFEGSGALRADRGLQAALAVTYTLPFQVALGPRPDVGIISGTVRTSAGAPLVGAVISAGGGLGVTDADGVYVVRNVPTGSHEVHLLTDTLDVADPVLDPKTPPEVDVRAGAVVDVGFSVSPGATLEGRIVPVLASDADSGEAVGPATGPERLIGGAWVEVTDGDVVLRGLTDARGSFRFPGMAAGTWTVRVTRPGLPSDWRLEGTERTFELQEGETREMLVDLVAVRRTIRFQDGGSVGGGD